MQKENTMMGLIARKGAGSPIIKNPESPIEEVSSIAKKNQGIQKKRIVNMKLDEERAEKLNLAVYKTQKKMQKIAVEAFDLWFEKNGF